MLKNINSKTFFHHPSERSDIRTSARNHLVNLVRKKPLLARDLNILLALEDVGILTRHQIEQLFFPSKATAVRRLKHLYDNHLLDCGSDAWFQFIKDDVDRIIPMENKNYGLQKSFTYTPSLVGRHVIAHEKRIAIDQTIFDPARYNAFYHSNVTIHDLWISEAYVKFRLVLQKLDLPFFWKNEKLSIINYRDETHKEVVRPDATFLTRFSIHPGEPDFQSAKFIEMDRGSTRWENKVSMYNLAFEEGDWKKTYSHFPFVLCVVPDRLYQKAIQSIKPNLGPVEFCVTSWSEFLKDPLSWFSVNAEENISILPSHYRK